MARNDPSSQDSHLPPRARLPGTCLASRDVPCVVALLALLGGDATRWPTGCTTHAPRAGARHAALHAFKCRAVRSVAVALPDGMLVATSDLRAPGPVRFTLLAAARSAVGRALRTRAAVFAHRPPCEFSGLDDLDAAHAARGCNLICCVPIHAVPEAGEGGLPVVQARRCKTQLESSQLAPCLLPGGRCPPGTAYKSRH